METKKALAHLTPEISEKVLKDMFNQKKDHQDLLDLVVVKDQEDLTEKEENQVCQENLVYKEKKEKLVRLDQLVKMAVMVSMVNVVTQEESVPLVVEDPKENKVHLVSTVLLVTKV